MCETFSKEGKSSIEAAAIEKMQGKIFLRCVTLSNWKGKAANAMQRVLQDVLHRKEAKQLERKNCKRKGIDILTIGKQSSWKGSDTRMQPTLSNKF